MSIDISLSIYLYMFIYIGQDNLLGIGLKNMNMHYMVAGATTSF